MNWWRENRLNFDMPHTPPPIDLLEATHEFPCTYVIKAIGVTAESFVERVLTAVKSELNSENIEHKLRESSNGKHVSVHLELMVRNAKEVQAVYLRLAAVRGLILLL